MGTGSAGVKRGTTRRDPITGRMISGSCWNGFHEVEDAVGDMCPLGCKCLCHDKGGGEGGD